MNKVILYIRNGKGKGLLLLLLAAVILAFLVFFPFRQNFKRDYAQLQPQMLRVADDLLPVTVHGGKIVDPIGVYKEFELNFGQNTDDANIFSIVFDTREEASQVTSDKVWLFVTRDMLYFPLMKKKITFQDGVFDKAKFTQLLQTLNSVFPLIFFIMVVIFSGFLFCILLLQCLILAWCSKELLKVLKKTVEIDFSVLMRMSVIVVLVVEILLLNVNFGILQRLIIELLCVLLFITKYNKELVQ